MRQNVKWAIFIFLIVDALIYPNVPKPESGPWWRWLPGSGIAFAIQNEFK